MPTSTVRAAVDTLLVWAGHGRWGGRGRTPGPHQFGDTTAWYLPDNLGSVRDIVNSAGAELDHIVYDSFGNIVTETNATNGDRFKFAGMEYSPATGNGYDRLRVTSIRPPVSSCQVTPMVFQPGRIS